MLPLADSSVRSHPAEPSQGTALWHCQAHMPTVKQNERVIVRGEGAYVWTETGQRLLDLPASLWYCNVGHGRQEIANAVAEQMCTLETYSSFQQYATEPALKLAERVVGLSPLTNAKVFFTSGGSDTVDLAAKLVRRYWSAIGRPDKRMIVTREDCYHGLHGFGTSISGIQANRDGYGTLIADTARVATNDAVALERLIQEKGASTIAAFFCEPIIGTGGVVLPSDAYLTEAQRICRAYDILFVVDEVITGFGRTGEMFASSRYGLMPDIILTAKGITSGYLPLGAAIISELICEPFWADGSELIFRHGLTYSGHSTACAAALANIDILEREELVGRVRELESVLHSALQSLNDHELVREVRSGVGLLGAVQLHEREIAARVAERCVDGGTLARLLNDGSLQISPPFVITADEITDATSAIRSALDWALTDCKELD